MSKIRFIAYKILRKSSNVINFKNIRAYDALNVLKTYEYFYGNLKSIDFNGLRCQIILCFEKEEKLIRFK
uniref:Uncharacterized protein n=1 Tax=viral metagenome TaxID=1070528 RepID=A0A6M3LST9_9ZZZZ